MTSSRSGRGQWSITTPPERRGLHARSPCSILPLGAENLWRNQP